MDATRLNDDRALIDDRLQSRATSPTSERAAPVPACWEWLPPPRRRTARADRLATRIRFIGQRDGFVLVDVAGVVDIACRNELNDVLARAVSRGEPAVIVDLSAVTLLAAAGYGCLEQAADRLAHRGGRLHLVCPTRSAAARIVGILGTGGWHLHTNLQAAVAAVGGGR